QIEAAECEHRGEVQLPVEEAAAIGHSLADRQPRMLAKNLLDPRLLRERAVDVFGRVDLIPCQVTAKADLVLAVAVLPAALLHVGVRLPQYRLKAVDPLVQARGS